MALSQPDHPKTLRLPRRVRTLGRRRDPAISLYVPEQSRGDRGGENHLTAHHRTDPGNDLDLGTRQNAAGVQFRPEGLESIGRDSAARILLDGTRSPLAIRKLSSYSEGMSRRKQGSVLPLEYSVLAAVTELQSSRLDPYGYSIAAAIATATEVQTLTSHGTLYKALGRMTDAGLLVARWEDPDVATGEGRPRRRVYEVTAEGAQVLEAHRVLQQRSAPVRVPIRRVVGA